MSSKRSGDRTDITAALGPGIVERVQARVAPACLIQIAGGELGKRIMLTEARTTVGRAPTCEVPIDDKSVSRTHAIIERARGAYSLRDLGSTNGTQVNDAFIESVELRDGDILRFGSHFFKFLSGTNVENQYHDEVYRLTTTDALTQVHNKRYLVEALDRELSRALRYERTLALLMIDVDHFKRVNDTLGHAAGDVVLREVARRLRSAIRRADTLARYGGEEFCVIAPEVDLAGAAQLGEKLRRRVGEAPIEVEGQSLRVTVSVGAADLSEYMSTSATRSKGGSRSDADADLLVRLADRKLYQAKEKGRDRVVA